MKSIGLVACGVVLLVGVSTAWGSIIWTAPSVSYTSGVSAKVGDYYLLVASTASDSINSYNVQATLTPISVTSGSLTFGTATEPSTNYVFTSAHAGYTNQGTNNFTTITGTDGLNSGTNALGTTAENLVKIPLNIAAGTVGTWNVSFTDSVGSPTGTCSFFDGAFNNIANASFSSGTLTVAPEPATMCLLALGGLALMRKRRIR